MLERKQTMHGRTHDGQTTDARGICYINSSHDDGQTTDAGGIRYINSSPVS